MSTEPKPTFEDRLQAYAQERRQQAGAPFTMPQALRTKLLTEAEQRYALAPAPKPPPRPAPKPAVAKPGWWLSLGPRFAWVGATAALLLVCALVVFLPDSDRSATSHLAQVDPALIAGATGGPAQERAAMDPTNASSGPGRAGDHYYALLRSNLAPAASAAPAQTAPRPLAAPAQAPAPEPVAPPPPTVTLRPTPDTLPGVSTPEPLRVSSATAEARSEPSSPPVPPSPDPVPAPPVVTAPATPVLEPAPEASTALARVPEPSSPPEPPSPDPAPAPPVVTAAATPVLEPAPDASTALARVPEPVPAPQPARRAAMRGVVERLTPVERSSRAGQAFQQVNLQRLRPNFNSPPALPVLNEFTVEQVGDQLQFTDQDGSVYTGRPRPAPSNTVQFQAIGTNRALEQRVVFDGRLVLTNTELAQTPGFQDSALPPANLFNLWLRNAVVRGQATVGERTRLEIEAAPPSSDP